MDRADHALAGWTRISEWNDRWPNGTEPPPEWWHTPVGRCCARSFGPGTAESVTRTVTAAMLGVHPAPSPNT